MGVNALDNPLRLRLTRAQPHDITQVEALVAELKIERLRADQPYDDTDYIGLLLAAEMEVVVPPRRRRKERREYDTHWYK